MKEDRSRVNRFMLYMEMILAAPGKGLHVLLKKFRRRPDIGRAVFLFVTLFLVGIGLWLMRKNTLLLLGGGIALAVLAFLIYKPVLKGISALLLFLEAGTHVFAASYDECRKSLKRRSGKSGRKAAPKTEQRAKQPEEEQPKTREQREAERQAWEEARQKASAEKRYQQTQRKKKRMEEEAEKERAKRGGPKHKKQEPHESSAALEEAKSIFNVEIPFTEAEIKEKRNLLIKKYHPDNPEGSEEMCKKINECYAILYKYAV